VIPFVERRFALSARRGETRGASSDPRLARALAIGGARRGGASDALGCALSTSVHA
jgi:hypothetical protein